jgi:hypothetical protein
MAWETAEPPAPESPQAGRSEQRSEDAQAERFGPVALTRVRKDDGRALILYRHLGEEPV